MNIRAVIFGATGMVGEGVLHECLQHPDVESSLVVGRSSCSVSHPKLTELIHDDFFDWGAVEERLTGFNACFFCLGTTSVGKAEPEYSRTTYALTLAAARTLSRLNPGMTFCYVSGVGTDSTERGNSMWARVKGKTENELLRLPFRAAYMFRPGYIQPTKGLKNAYTVYRIVGPLYPLWKTLFPRYVCTLRELGLAMIRTVSDPGPGRVLENADILTLAKR